MLKVNLNLRNVIAIAICLAGSVTMFAQNNTTDEGVMIAGVKWATRNVGKSGTFVSSPQDYGNLYTWEDAQYVCPKGWRLPTKKEFETLSISGKWTTIPANGYIFGSGNNIIFLPAAGYEFGEGTQSEGHLGYYWSRSKYEGHGGYAYYLYINEGLSQTTEFALISYYGYSVRCVAE